MGKSEMGFKNTVLRSIIIITILILSVLIGYVYQTIWHHIDLMNYPQEYSELVITTSATTYCTQFTPSTQVSPWFSSHSGQMKNANSG